MGITVGHGGKLAGPIGYAAFAGGREDRRRSDAQVGIQYAGLSQRQQQIDYQQYQGERNFAYKVQSDQQNYQYQIAQDEQRERNRVSDMNYRAYALQLGDQHQQEQQERSQQHDRDMVDIRTGAAIEVSEAEYEREEFRRSYERKNIIAAAESGIITPEVRDQKLLEHDTGQKFVAKKPELPSLQDFMSTNSSKVLENGEFVPNSSEIQASGMVWMEQGAHGPVLKTHDWKREKPTPAPYPSGDDLTKLNIKRAEDRRKYIADARKKNEENNNLGVTESDPEYIHFDPDAAVIEAWERHPNWNGEGGPPQGAREPNTLKEAKHSQAYKSGWKKVQNESDYKLTKSESAAIRQEKQMVPTAGKAAFELYARLENLYANPDGLQRNAQEVLSLWEEIIPYDATGRAKQYVDKVRAKLEAVSEWQNKPVGGRSGADVLARAKEKEARGDTLSAEEIAAIDADHLAWQDAQDAK